MERPVIIYEPSTRQNTGFLASLVLMVRNIAASRELIWQLFKRDFLASYRKSFLGLTWLVIAPIFSVLSWIFMNAAGILRPGDVGMPYPAFVLLSTTIWGLFLGFYQMSAETLNVGSGFIMQVKYPHEALLAKQILQQLANFSVNFVVIIVALAFFGVFPSWQTVFLPLLILPMLFLGAAIGLFVSIVGVVAAEVRKGIDVVMGVLIFVTPVIYSVSSMQGSLATLVKWNPLTYLVGSVRDVIAFGRLDNPEAFLWCSLGAVIAFLISWRLFFISEDRVIEKML
jgi:lipopolysaccharide transport system permease protein